MNIQKDTGYGPNQPNNFVLDVSDTSSLESQKVTELTVTITLNEYRSLIEEVAKSKQKTEDLDNWQLRRRIEELENELSTLAIAKVLNDESEEGM